jgi:hypothetical protein
VRRIVIAAVVATMLALSPGLRAQPGASKTDVTSAQLRRASSSLARGEYKKAARTAGGLTRASWIERQDRAEAYRIYGLALFFLDRRKQAEKALLAYLKLEPNAHLDPTQAPPEALVFFADVRSRNAAIIAASRPKPKRKMYWYLNLVPPFGQFQNRHRGKGWVIAVGGTLSLAMNVTTFLVLRSWCDQSTGVCTREDSARKLEVVNLVSGAAALGLFAYGVLDGFHHYRRIRKQERRGLQLGIVPERGGARLTLGARF